MTVDFLEVFLFNAAYEDTRTHTHTQITAIMIHQLTQDSPK
jgi:hypothetical protein